MPCWVKGQNFLKKVLDSHHQVRSTMSYVLSTGAYFLVLLLGLDTVIKMCLLISPFLFIRNHQRQTSVCHLYFHVFYVRLFIYFGPRIFFFSLNFLWDMVWGQIRTHYVAQTSLGDPPASGSKCWDYICEPHTPSLILVCKSFLYIKDTNSPFAVCTLRIVSIYLVWLCIMFLMRQREDKF